MLKNKEEIHLAYLAGNLIEKISRGEVLKSDENRIVCCNLGTEIAYSYALHIDKGPHDLTREISSQKPDYAVIYALFVDKKEHNVTRNGACVDPEWAFLYAESIDQRPYVETKESTSRIPETKMSYEILIERVNCITK